ncbi:MAG TPA: hypothetical protein VGX00_08575 [Thermoplasmata archaeon]|nr:hypothetical protein [Thermoplasmata archaeon]
MLPDWVDILNLALGIVGTSGVLILVRQWYVDTYSHTPYRFDTQSGVWLATRVDGTAQLSLKIANRRSTPTKINILLGVPSGRGIRGLPKQGLRLLPFGSPPLLTDDFELPGKATRMLFLQGLLPNAEYSDGLRIMVTDAEGFRKMSDYRLGQSEGEVPPELAGRPPVYGLRAAGDFGPP